MEGGIRFGLGATMATTKTVLREIGGLAPLADYLGRRLRTRRADCGRRVTRSSWRIRLSETALPDYSFRDFWLHQMRWARNVKDRRPAQYVGLIVTFGLRWAMLAVLARPLQLVDVADSGVTAAARFASAIVVGRGVLNDRSVCAISGCCRCAISLRWLSGLPAIAETRSCGGECGSG